MNVDNDPPIIAERLAIESLEDYIERYGLPASNINDDDGRNGEFNGLNRTEAQERMQAEKAYLDAFIEKHHSNNNNSSEQAPLKSGFTPREDCRADGVISVLLANKKRHDVPIQPVYQYCDAVRRMAVHRCRFGVANDSLQDGSDDSSDDARDLTNNSKSSESYDGTLLELSLEDFDADATLQFMSALQSLHEHQLIQQQQQKQKVAMDNTKQHHSSTQIDQNVQQPIDESSSCTEHIIHLIDTQSISSDSIIEVLKISHFLQCNIILDTLVSIVESSIDLENCLSICSLADALNLTSLFESSVHFVIRRLDAFQGSSGDNAEEEAGEEKGELTTAASSPDEDFVEELWKSLPYDLRSRVLTMRNILRSSIIGRGSKMSGVFFSSGNEFLAIFRETISVQKERLAEARERLEEVVRERKEEFDVKRQRRGRWFDSSAAAEEKFVYGGDVAYSKRQIDRQAKRLATLESFYQEQKMIFGKGGGRVGECKLSFSSSSR